MLRSAYVIEHFCQLKTLKPWLFKGDVFRYNIRTDDAVIAKYISSKEIFL